MFLDACELARTECTEWRAKCERGYTDSAHSGHLRLAMRVCCDPFADPEGLRIPDSSAVQLSVAHARRSALLCCSLEPTDELVNCISIPPYPCQKQDPAEHHSMATVLFKLG